MEIISGGVTAAKGFTASGVHCGVKAGSPPEKKDLALIVSEKSCTAAGVFTRNKVKAAPVQLSMENLKDGRATAIIINSGNANACAPEDMENARKMASLTAEKLGIDTNCVVTASTGVIGQRLNIQAIEDSMDALIAGLGKNSSDAAAAIMTTDTVEKELAICYESDGVAVTIGGICKGSGMIHPNMGTMLCFITTDAKIGADLLRELLQEAIRVSINRVTIDGDTSTNDCCVVLANGMSGTCEIKDGKERETFLSALTELCTGFARMLAADGEGATKLITCRVSGAINEGTAECVAKSVIASSLVKTAMFGADANWGRILCAMGYSGADFRPEEVSVVFSSEAGSIEVCKDGRGLSFDELLAKEILSAKEVIVDVVMGSGEAAAICWGCDLTYDYVRINGDYRT